MANPKKKSVGRPKEANPASDLICVRFTHADAERLRAEASESDRTISSHVSRMVEAITLQAQAAGMDRTDYVSKVIREHKKGK